MFLFYIKYSEKIKYIKRFNKVFKLLCDFGDDL